MCAACFTKRQTVILTRSSAESGLRTWGLALKERLGFKRAAVAVARKLAVTMHAMLRSGEMFDRIALAERTDTSLPGRGQSHSA